MVFVGIDFAWTDKNPSGLASLAWDGEALLLSKTDRKTGISAILNWVEAECRDGDGLVAVDAPTIIRNFAGQRPAEAELHRRFGKYDAGPYPANLSRPFARETTRLGCLLETLGFKHAATIVPQVPGRFQIEVFPHPAIVQLFDLGQIVKYKKGRVAKRASELSRLRDLMLRYLPETVPHLAPPMLPIVSGSEQELKAIEDQLDAVICAYIAAHWWYWGCKRNEVFGDADSGYIIVPKRIQRAPSLVAAGGKNI